MGQAAGLVAWLAVTFAAAAMGGWGSRSAPTFYRELAKPDWAPPAWLFGPVWTALYTMMAVAAWLVWRKEGFRGAAWALGLFLAQLVANALWSWLFFAWRTGPGAIADIVLLIALVIATAALFARRNGWAAALLAPYLAWICFAAALTVALVRRNPSLL